MQKDFEQFQNEIDRSMSRVPIFLTVSEEDARELSALGYSATTDVQAARGGNVYVFGGQSLAEAVSAVADSVHLIDESGDIAGVIARCGEEDTAKAITALCTRARRWTPQVFGDFGFYSVPDLTEEERRPPEFIIEGMIPVGMTFLSGAPKTRKSFLAVQMAAAVASGTTFWGRSVTQCDVAYLDLEGSKSRISSRTERMSQPLPRNVFITNTIKDRLADGLVDKLRALHRERPAIRFIIIDTFSRARGIVNAKGANAYDADVALLEPMQRMAMEENISVLFVHHDKKGAALVGDSFERLSGTMGISGSADCVINLVADGKRADGRATLEYNPRDARGGELSLVFDETFLEWMAEEKPTLKGDPVCAWIIENRGDRGVEGHFWSYEDVFLSAYHIRAEKPGDRITAQLKPHLDELFTEFRIGVQIGVKSNGKRGIRITNYQ